MNKPTPLFNLVYYVGKTKMETVMWGKPKPLCIWKGKELAKTTHRYGRFEYETH